MVSSRRRRHFSPENETLDSEHSPSLIFQTLISQIESPQGLKAPLLKSLHYLLIHLSSNTMCPVNKGAGLNELIMEIGQTGIRVSMNDICRLSDLLFEELCKRFKQLFSAAHDVSGNRVLGQADFRPETCTAAEELNLLLRCCLIFLNLLVGQQHLILKNGRILLMILRQLSLLSLSGGGNEKNVINFVQLFSRECSYSDNDCAIYFTEEFVASLSFLEPSDPCIPIISSILEVFLDELLVHAQLRKYFKLIDSVSSTGEMLFMPSCGIDNIGIVIEVMSGHFSVSIPDEQAFEDFLNKLSWLHGKNFRVPELSLNVAISLLCNPVMLSAPKFMQAHMISLVSEATCSDMNCENWKPDPRRMDCYLIAFERSVNLYTKHMSSVKMDGCPASFGNSFVRKSIYGENFQPYFESYIQPVRRKKLNVLITKLDDSWHSHLRSSFLKTQSDLVTSSIAFIKESQGILDITCRDEILSVLSCMILRAPSDVNNISLHTNGDTSLQDICLLASLLKLMSSSLLQALRSLRRDNISSCKEYDCILAIISCFRKFNMDLPIQKSFCDMTETQPQKHKESKLMLLHFLGLLSLSFISGIEFLVKGCILIIMALMNLFVYEEGNLDALRSLIDSRSDSFSDGQRFPSVQKDAVDQKTSFSVASKFQKIQTLYLSMASSPPTVGSARRGMDDGRPDNLANGLIDGKMEGGVGIEEETCNGEIFLKSITRCQKLSKVDDLADFIACKQGKDYCGWLKGRQKYRKWKCEKMAALRWERKKRTWKFMKRR